MAIILVCGIKWKNIKAKPQSQDGEAKAEATVEEKPSSIAEEKSSSVAALG